MIRQREERSRITIWSGGQTSGWQTSGGQTSGGQTSGGQTSGGQTSGPHTIVSLSFEHNVLKCVGLRVGVNLEKRTLIAGCRADGSEKLAPRCLPSVKTPVKAHPGGSSVRAWPQGRRWRWRAVEREENKWAVSTHFPPSQDIAPKPDSLILTAATAMRSPPHSSPNRKPSSAVASLLAALPTRNREESTNSMNSIESRRTRQLVIEVKTNAL